jgi:outer membrane protein
MKNVKLAALAMGALLALAAEVRADAGDLYGHLRVINIKPKVSSNIPGLDVDTRTTAELGLTYFFTREIAGELGVTQAKHDVTLNGANIGDIKITPVNLAIQYHWNMGTPFTPYAGAGINFTSIGSVNLGGIGLDSSSTGGLLQLGANYDLNKQFRLNGDIKKIWLNSDVFAAGGAKLGDVDVDPWALSVGIAMKF